MSTLIHYYPGDQALDLLLVVTLGVALASSAAWLISRRLAGKAALRHLVLFSALVCCLAFPAVAWFCGAAGLTLVSIPILRGEQHRMAPGVMQRATQIETDPVRTPPRPSTDPPHVAEALPLPHTYTTTGESLDVAVAPAADQSPAMPAPSKSSVQPTAERAATLMSFRGIATAAMLVWAAGTLLMLARLARNCGRVVQLRRSSRAVQNGRLQTLLQEVASQLGARQAPLLLVSSRTVTPLAVGFGRPAVVLPQRLLGTVSDDELRDVLLHEVAHVERGDHWIVLLEELAGALYWPIVSVHGLNRELRRASEEVCDNVVLACRDAISYGETLLHVAELLVKARPIGAAVGIIGGQGELERRIRGLIDPRRNTMATTGRTTACVVTFLFIAGGAIASTTRFAASADPVIEGPQAGSKPPVSTTATGTERSDAKQTDKPPREADSERTILLHGKVLGPGDRPVAGARLYLNVDEWTDPIELGTSDDNGSYRFVVPEEKLRRTVTGGFQHNKRKASLIAVAEGLGPGWAELPDVYGGRYGEMKPEYANDLRLATDFAIAGRVVDADGKSVVGAVVGVGAIHELSDSRWHKMHPAIEANDPDLMTRDETDTNNWFTPLYPTAWRMIPAGTTDSEGRFRIAGVGHDRAIKLRVEGPGIRTASVSVITREDVDDFTQAIRAMYPRTRRPDGYFYPRRESAPDGDQGVRLFGPAPTIEVDLARTIAGTVRDASTGEPIAGMRVQVAGALGAGSARTDSHGRYRLLRAEDRSAISVFTRADYGDFYQRYLTVVRPLSDREGLGGEIVADFDVPRGVVIDGRVVESGTDRPIVSAPRQSAHDVEPGPLRAGVVTYFPLSTNTALRGTPTGLYFEGLTRSQNNSKSAEIDGDGGFRLAVPPGPGVLLVRAEPGRPLPMLAQLGGGVWKEREGLHRLFPYVKLTTRAKDDGAPDEEAQSFPGFTGPIPLANYHAYRVIDPPADATSLELTLNVPRAPSRVLRFVDPDGRAIRGVRVQGLVARPMTFVIDGSEAEVIGLEAGQPRQVIAMTDDGKYIARTFVGADDPQPKTVRLEPAASASGRLLDAATGQPLADYSARLTYPAKEGADGAWVPWMGEGAKTDADGRFLIGGVIPGLGASVSFQEPRQPWTTIGPLEVYQPDSLRDLVLRTGEVRDLGDVRIKPPVDEETETKAGN